MKDYELAYLLNSGLKEEEILPWKENLKNVIISELSGEFKKEINIKKRKLAYSVNKQIFAYFGSIYFTLSPDKIEVLEKKIKIDKNILRYLLLHIDKRKQKELLRKEKDILEKIFSTDQNKKPEPIIEIPGKPKVGLEELDKKIEEILEKPNESK